MNVVGEFQIPNCLDDIYYHRECVCYSLEGRLVDLITISSYHNMSSEREIRLKHLFPMVDVPRPFRFHGKKVIYFLGLLLLCNPFCNCLCTHTEIFQLYYNVMILNGSIDIQNKIK